LTLEDREIVHEMLWQYQPQTSELTFTNLYIWRDTYHPQWCILDDVLLIIGRDDGGDPYAFPPVSLTSRVSATRALLEWLRDEQGVAAPRVLRAGARLAEELEGAEGFEIEPTRDHFDYVYEREDLAELAGRDYSNKRNHINFFMRNYEFTYEPLVPETLEAASRVACEWCEKYRCEDDMNLMEERDAVQEALKHFETLRAKGGLIRVEGRVEAFAIGEMLNDETLVVHIEKADPDIRGLYPLINREFVRHCCTDAKYVNREQDLGVPGLRRAKKSYNPARMVKKYRVTFSG
jgi:hypothetical protein